MRQNKLDPIRGESLATMVVESVRNAIYAGRFTPGDAVREMQIARELRVSQTTVREALLQLEHAGLVVREANRGTRITILTEQDIRERTELRIVLEEKAAIEAGRRITSSELTELDNRKRQLMTAIRRNQYYEAAQLDLAFHRVLWRVSGNQTLLRMLDDLTAPLFAFVSVRQSSNLEDLQRRVGTHEFIFKAVQLGKAPGIRKAIRDHLVGAYLLAKSSQKKGSLP